MRTRAYVGASRSRDMYISIFLSIYLSYLSIYLLSIYTYTHMLEPIVEHCTVNSLKYHVPLSLSIYRECVIYIYLQLLEVFVSLSLSTYIHLSIHLSIRRSVHLSIHLNINIYICISIFPNVRWRIARRGGGLGSTTIREVGSWGRVPLERWGAGVEYHFQEFNEPYSPS